MFAVGREHFRNKEFNTFFRLYFALFGAPEIGAKIRSRLALREIRESQFKSFLDAGCGKGYISFQVAKNYPDAQIVGIDADSTKIKSNTTLKKFFNLSNLHYEETNLLQFSSKKKFDIILVSDVLEHIKDDVEVLRKFRSYINDNGKLITHTPRSEEHYFFKKSAEYVVKDHVRPGYTEEELSHKLQMAGFKITKIIPSYSFFESLANQIGNIFSNNLLIYSILLPVLTLLSHVPPTLLKKKNNISNTLIIIAEPAL